MGQNISMPAATKKKGGLLFLTFSLILAAVILYDLDKYYGIYVINDEFGYWGIAASWAGQDWSSLLGSTPYYSFGYSILLVPLYWMGIQPHMMYRVALIYNALFLIGSFLLAVKCSQQLFPKRNEKLRIFICFTITLYSNNIIQAHFAWTESLLYFLFWLLFYVIISVVQKPSTMNIMASVLITGYMYYVHQRTVGVLLSVIIFFSILFFCKKVSFKQIALCMALIGLVFLAGSQIKNEIINSLFTNDELVAMNNYEGQTGKIVSILTTLEGLTGFVESVLGKVFYLAAATFMTGAIALIWIGQESVLGLIEIIKTKTCSNMRLIQGFLFMAFFGSLLISAIAMSPPTGRLDILIYGRYMEFAIGPLLLFALEYVLYNCLKKPFIAVGSFVMLSIVILIDNIWSSINTKIYNGVCIATLKYFFQNMTQVEGLVYIIFLSSIFVFLLVLFFRKNFSTYNYCRYVLIGIILCGWLFFGNSDDIVRYQKEINRNVSEIVLALNKNDSLYSEIYYVNNKDENNQYGKYLQYALLNRPIRLFNSEEAEKVLKFKDACVIVSPDSDEYLQIKIRRKLLVENDWFAVFFTDDSNIETPWEY